MLPTLKTIPVVVLSAILVLSCEPSEVSSELATAVQPFELDKRIEKAKLNQASQEQHPRFENLQDVVLSAVTPSECGPTKFNEVSGTYFEKLLLNPEALKYLNQYQFLNRQAARLEINSDFFGNDGGQTNRIKKLERDLQRFWNLDKEIEFLGQHNSTLRDREKLADIFWYSIQDMESRAEAYALADEILRLNKQFPELINSPLISTDGFAAQNGKIIIGDGLIQLFVEAGIQENIVWTGILSHEWAHQIQFHYYKEWYENYNFESDAEATRLLELESDFFSGYYMTHKRGATFNWKKTEEFLELFYQSGDCAFQFSQHHGTPIQRKMASYEGFLLAEAARKKGQILSPGQLHQYFLEKVLPGIVQDLQYL